MRSEAKRSEDCDRTAPNPHSSQTLATDVVVQMDRERRGDASGSGHGSIMGGVTSEFEKSTKKKRWSMLYLPNMVMGGAFGTTNNAGNGNGRGESNNRNKSGVSSGSGTDSNCSVM